MLAGHFAIGLAAKRIAPQVSLGTMVLAAMLADVLAFPLVMAGVEHFRIQSGAQSNRMVGDGIAYSHSLLTDAVWGALFAAVYFLWRRNRLGAWVLFGAVLSHWVLDVVSHRPDMPLAPGVPAVFGLGLWNSIPATLVIEGGLWLAAIVWYARATHSKTRAGTWAFWGGVAVLTLAWWGNITATPTSNPNAAAAAASLVFFSCFVAWGYWMNRLRLVEAHSDAPD